ncbi:hypothetical protein HRW07_21690 [Streptomyces lunaelactis]|uniref:hypothetical protein n=1 Tax=Streptomyces lunaelactis TaxID=1535768 RepID=UPI001585181A|nr:hypothetical protein [Streptomyces lunaelactis]NUL05795.1 hypothetical protein [Streptomyces lunaelactis]
MNLSQPTRRTIRTVVQTVLALAARLPLIIDAVGIPQTAARVGLALVAFAVAGLALTLWQLANP